MDWVMGVRRDVSVEDDSWSLQPHFEHGRYRAQGPTLPRLLPALRTMGSDGSEEQRQNGSLLAQRFVRLVLDVEAIRTTRATPPQKAEARHALTHQTLSIANQIWNLAEAGMLSDRDIETANDILKAAVERSLGPGHTQMTNERPAADGF